MNYTYITLILSIILTVIFWVKYNTEIKKKKKNRNETNIKIFLYSGIVSLLSTLGTLAYIIYKYMKNSNKKRIEYYSKKLLDDFSGPLPDDEKKYVVLEDCDNLYKSFPDKKAAEEYLTFKKDTEAMSKKYQMQLLEATTKGDNDLVKKLNDKLRDLEYIKINFCKTSAMTNLNFSNWNAYLQSK